jgi:hypothetical protein
MMKKLCPCILVDAVLFLSLPLPLPLLSSISWIYDEVVPVYFFSMVMVLLPLPLPLRSFFYWVHDQVSQSVIRAMNRY